MVLLMEDLNFSSIIYNSASEFNIKRIQVDELMIANMLSVLNNRAIADTLEEQELDLLFQVVKNHVLLKAKMTLEEQRYWLNEMNNGRSR